MHEPLYALLNLSCFQEIQQRTALHQGQVGSQGPWGSILGSKRYQRMEPDSWEVITRNYREWNQNHMMMKYLWRRDCGEGNVNPYTTRIKTCGQMSEEIGHKRRHQYFTKTHDIYLGR